MNRQTAAASVAGQASGQQKGHDLSRKQALTVYHHTSLLGFLPIVHRPKVEGPELEGAPSATLLGAPELGRELSCL